MSIESMASLLSFLIAVSMDVAPTAEIDTKSVEVLLAQTKQALDGLRPASRGRDRTRHARRPAAGDEDVTVTNLRVHGRR